MKHVLVIDANQRSALAVTRSLGKKGVPVYTAEETSNSLAGMSCYSKQFFQYPSPKLSSETFINTLCALVKQYQIDILLPMTELTTELLLANQSKFDTVIIPSSDLSSINMLADKCALMRMAYRLNVPTPQTWYADTPDKLPITLNNIQYPLILKPGKSWLQYNDCWTRAAVRRADNASSARTILESEVGFHSHPFILQKYVEGYGAGVFALYDRGKPLAFFAHNRIREKPPSGGVSVLSESTDIDPILLKHAQVLLSEANWHGIAMVEFKVATDGTPYLMEINTRFWGSLQLAIDAGVDFPWLLYQLACNEKPDTVAGYKKGIRLRWLLGDLDNLYLTFKDSQLSYVEKFKAFVKFLIPAPFKTRHEVNRWGDFAPAWYELKQYVRDILKSQ